MAIKLCKLETGETFQVTEPVLQDMRPAFDPDGKYLYFLGYRVFNPIHDNLQFDLSFPRGMKPYVVLLRRDLKSPFIPEPKMPEEKEKEKEKEEPPKKPQDDANDSKEEETADEQWEKSTDEERKEENGKKPASLVIDLEGIQERVLPVPVSEGRYSDIRGVTDKVLCLSHPVDR